MKTIVATLCSLLLIVSSQAQDPVVSKTISFYEEKMLPAFQDLFLRQKVKLHQLAANPPQKDIKINLQMANLYAALLQFDSAMYYVQQELARGPIDKELYDHGFFILLAKEPAAYKKFTDSVFFGRYNTDTAGRKRYLPSDLAMKYIRNRLMANFFYLIERNGGFNKRREWQLVNAPYNQFQKELQNSMKGEEVYTERLPQYSKDGAEITTSIVSGLFGTEMEAKEMVAKRMSEIETLLIKKDIAWEDYLCKLIDERLLELGKPQRYGTQIKITNNKAALKTPHDNPKEIEKRRQQVGLITLAEYFTKKIEEEEFFKKMPAPVSAY